MFGRTANEIYATYFSWSLLPHEPGVSLQYSSAVKMLYL